jgi:hypothetical protein
VSLTPTDIGPTERRPRITRPRDPRTFWRIALAVLAPVPWIALAISTILTPDNTRDDDKTAYAAIAAHTGQAGVGMAFGIFFLLGLLPAIVAVLWACRRQAPRLTAWVGGITVLGAISGMNIPVATRNDYLAARQGLDQHTVLSLNDAQTNQPAVLVLTLLFLIGVILFGRVLLGVLLWRSGVAPRWMACALIIAAPLDVFGPSGLLIHNDAAWLSYLLSAIGFAAASLALLRTTNDEFDLPAAAPHA